jgi:hypothetical protein
MEDPGTLERMVSEGAVRAPAELGTPELIPELAEDVTSVSDLVTYDRDQDRNR